jgi:hypothetical protein
VRLFSTPFVGAQVLLVVGLAALLWRAVAGSARQDKTTDASLRLSWLVPLAGWWLMAVLIYVMRLPVTYQHGRYLMPIIPALLVVGGVGAWIWLQPSSSRQILRLLSLAWLMSYGAVTLTFLVVGARSYALDTRFIETEMVATAQWLEANTPPDALVAAHDIGALGYVARRDLIDLAGLVSPEVIPFIRDEDALLRHVLEREADYLVTFPSWYPQMVTAPELEQVFTTDAPWAPAMGRDNMAVYAVRHPGE